MTPAERARNQAISLEAKKDALSQRQSGDWKVSFTVQGIDMDARLTQAPMGTRYAVVLVEIGDDELPVNKPAKESKQAVAVTPDARPQPTQPQAGAKRSWREMPKSQQAGICIGEPEFSAYLREEHPKEWRETGDADACLKLMCGGITSKSELVTDHKAGALWFQIDAAYHAWKALENA